MVRTFRYLSILITIFGFIALAISGAFISQAISKNNFLIGAMKEEKITVGLTPEQVQRGEIVDTAPKAQKAADTIRGHRQNIAPTYNELLGGKQFDPTNPKQITYMQALNLENYLYTTVLTSGVITIAGGAGAFMILTGIVDIIAGLILFSMARKPVG
ncbi:MAG: hypothetical protein Q7R50_08580 [Dehalococcoidales bacterium]|nr:hypothetical protein [Dehalococcoidales bacterium]